jgi:hypothetical protein
MGRFKDEEPQARQEGWKPSRADVNQLREKMKHFSEKIINGRKQYPFNQYLEAEGIVSFDKHGDMQVRQPLPYKRAFETYDLHQYIEWEELQSVFQQFPEEKEAYDKKIARIFQEIRQILSRVAVEKRA